MSEITEKELAVLSHFVGDHCEQIGKLSGIGPKTWMDLAAKGLIEECENDEGYRITTAGQAALN